MPSLEKARIISNSKQYHNLYIMEIEAPQTVKECKPGQFLHIRSNPGLDPLLRRPLSLYDVDKEAAKISLLYKVVGKGTALLADMLPGENLDIMGPLGRGFSLPESAKKCLLVGGGVGMAPLLYLARELRRGGSELLVLYGVGNEKELLALERLEAIGSQVQIATIDGSRGLKGPLIPPLFSEILSAEHIEFIYSCGPESMMKLWQEWARINHISGEVSLEEYMACGVGACLGCARKAKPDNEFYVKICQDGPVFRLDELELE
ncbi:dihydroorotate dehydrogenase electron transfer subunit [Syntrophomonas wolfei]|uniref:Dihydroorotate dehydrogenase B (NAD(+)), electron transfer subunit n=1 Tax=Syntrophomonas wolfei subsp. wolfei (strain DSM 2245B / Goettingen) TaxID=335541 RepID=Q0AXG5_SYNWW|nr:dihydroorotate dehydrogenase electron transfer subunit [Syntrophomonas wolfei]ABI68589.1 dihydroorotate oxidase B, electron transfer subunit [Syntrophomonas wolfei subsp. wolfei str. Goettingen G311]